MAKEVATKEAVGGVPAALATRMQADAGKGVSTAQEDNLVPLIYLLQALSPQVNKRGNDYIDGAEAGSIWLRNSPHPIVNGEVGILFQPCHFHKDWVEWVPRDSGGGLVARYENLPKDAKSVVDDKNPNKVRFVTPNGNEVMETRYHAGYAILDDGTALPYIIPLTSSGHGISRQWMFMMNSHATADGSVVPSWARTYRLKTKQRSNAAGTWFTWEVSEGDWVNDAAYERGARLFKAFETGTKQADLPQEGNQERAF